MDAVTKNKSLVSIIIFLLITNIAMVIFFLVLNSSSHRPSRNQNGMSEALQKEANFSKEQLDTYQSLRKNHFNKIHPLFDDLRKSKMDFYTLIYNPQVSDSSLNAAADLIAEKQKNLDMQMFKHFETVRNICTPDQLQKFDTVVKKVFTRMIAKTGKSNRDQKK